MDSKLLAAEKKDDESSNSLSERAHLLGNKDGEISARSSSRISYRFTGDLSKVNNHIKHTVECREIGIQQFHYLMNLKCKKFYS